MDAPTEIRFRLEGGGELVATRREGMLYALSFTALGSLVPEPKPQPEPEPGPGPKFTLLENPTGPIERRYANLGTIQGGSPFLDLSRGGNAIYDFRGTVREARLDGVTWRGAGSRSLYRCDGDPDGSGHPNADHEGGGTVGGAFLGSDITVTQEWGKLYQSKNPPTGTIHFRECSIRKFTIEAPRLHGGFDGFQNGSGTRGRCSDVTLLRWAMTGMRDDGVENDNWWDDLVVDYSLFDGFVFFSCRNTGDNGSKLDNYFRGNVVYLRPMMFEGAMTTGACFKLNTNAVRLNLADNVFAAEGPPHRTILGAFGDLMKYKKLGDCERNIFCWLGSGRNPHEVPSSGIEVLEGAEARQEYDRAVARFWAEYPGHRFSFDPPRPDV